MIRAFLKKSWIQYPTKQQLYDHLSSILQTSPPPEKKSQQGILGATDEVRTNSLVTFLHIDPLVLADQQKLSWISFVRRLWI